MSIAAIRITKTICFLVAVVVLSFHVHLEDTYCLQKWGFFLYLQLIFPCEIWLPGCWHSWRSSHKSPLDCKDKKKALLEYTMDPCLKVPFSHKKRRPPGLFITSLVCMKILICKIILKSRCTPDWWSYE